MGLPLLLGLLFSRTGGLLPQSIEQPNSCITAESLCLADPACNNTYRILESCSRSYAQNNFFILDHGARNKCLQAETMIRNSHFQECKCQRRTQKQEEQCLRIYWTVHSTVPEGDFNLEISPYKNVVSEESLKTNYNKLATRVSGSHLAGDSTNPCLQGAQVCSLNRRCGRLRAMYVSNCSPKDGHPCNQRKCHQELKHFFGRVDMDFTKRFLFCPCQDEFCGERRRKTIVPDCSFQNNSKPNCLALLDTCLKDYICNLSRVTNLQVGPGNILELQLNFKEQRCPPGPIMHGRRNSDFGSHGKRGGSRLADFQEQCKPSSSSSDGCFQHNHATCLEAYMGMIGTPMTPNYISNSTADVTLWCSCENSGNHKVDCEEIISLFSNNRCLRSAMHSQMGLNQVNTKDQEELQSISSPNTQRDGTSTVLTTKMYWESVKKMQPEVFTQNRQLFSHSVYSGDRLSLFTLALTLLLLLRGPP
ncbi:GDNF family receptor alpha-3 isoform X1 [Paroedura picta]|uniref:GDNF family receptor alpha-3 isoform X1 n=1 Tax=Paroedura picta TaxID=143630 RepID=UPI00405740E3